MPRGETYAGKHRGPSREASLKKGLKRSVVLSGVAVAATGVAVASGVLLDSQASAGTTALASASEHQVDATGHPAAGSAGHTTAPSADPSVDPTVDLGDRTASFSRSGSRTAIDPVKKQELSQDSGGQTTRTEDLANQDPKAIAQQLMPQYGFGADQWSCLDQLFTIESSWEVHATNPTSGAYGIPQALPASKLATAGSDWHDNAATQIKWGLEYIKQSYGSPCSALQFHLSSGWY